MVTIKNQMKALDDLPWQSNHGKRALDLYDKSNQLQRLDLLRMPWKMETTVASGHHGIYSTSSLEP